MSEPAVRKTVTRLADGRDLIYFDDSEPYVSGTATRRLDDPRPLPDRLAPVVEPDGVARPVTGPQMRYDVLTGEWVPMATARMNRTFLPPADANPLAPARPGAAYSDGEIPDTDYDVVVFENRFPSLMAVPGVPDVVTPLDGEELWPTRPAAGRCEVICFSPDSTASLAGVGTRRMRTVIEAWADRTRALGAVPGVEQVFCFENRGKEIGVTLHHPHGQIYAYPYLTPRTATMLRQARAHRERTGRNLLRDVLEAELRAGRRVVAQSAHWVAYVPAAARWPMEVHLAPRRDVPDLPALDDAERADLAAMYLRVLQAADRFFEWPADSDRAGEPIALPYIAAWHQAPVREGRADLRLHLQLFSVLRSPGKLKYLAGSESGMGAWVSDTTPEKIADRLREVMPAEPAEPAELAEPAAPASDLLTAWPETEGAERARALFARTFDAEPDDVWSAPGRVNLVGEHTDYNDGLCLPIALPHRTFVALRSRADGADGRPVRLVSAQEPGTDDGAAGDPVRILDLDAVGPAGAAGAVPGWPAYAVGVAWALEREGLARGLPAFDVAVDSCVPYGAGLSSSAALECAVAVALDEVAGLNLAGPPTAPDDAGRARLAAACVRAENEVAGAPTGGMDQAAALRARAGHALLLDCRDGSVQHVPLDLASAGLALLVIDTRAEHQLVDGQYASRRAACEEAARRLDVASLRVVADDVAAGGSLDAVLGRLADDVLRRRVRHVVTEIARVRELAGLLRAHPGAALREALGEVGAVLDDSHASARDDYEISSPELDLAVTTARAAGSHGARMTGGGFGGSAIALVDAASARGVASAVAHAFAGAGFRAPGFLLATAAGPAGRVGPDPAGAPGAARSAGAAGSGGPAESAGAEVRDGGA